MRILLQGYDVDMQKGYQWKTGSPIFLDISETEDNREALKQLSYQITDSNIFTIENL